MQYISKMSKRQLKPEESFIMFSRFVLVLICVLENVALNRSAWQQDTSFNFMAYRAVDGKKASLSTYGGECVTSQFANTTEWRVDLGNVLSIHHILIQFATDNRVWGKICILQLYLLNAPNWRPLSLDARTQARTQAHTHIHTHTHTHTLQYHSAIPNTPIRKSHMTWQSCYVMACRWWYTCINHQIWF